MADRLNELEALADGQARSYSDGLVVVEARDIAWLVGEVRRLREAVEAKTEPVMLQPPAPHVVDVLPANREQYRWECSCGEGSESFADSRDDAWDEAEAHANFCNNDPIFGDNGALARERQLEAEVGRLREENETLKRERDEARNAFLRIAPRCLGGRDV